MSEARLQRTRDLAPDYYQFGDMAPLSPANERRAMGLCLGYGWERSEPWSVCRCDICLGKSRPSIGVVHLGIPGKSIRWTPGRVETT